MSSFLFLKCCEIYTSAVKIITVNREKQPWLLLENVHFVQAIGVFHHLVPIAVSPFWMRTVDIYLQVGLPYIVPPAPCGGKDTRPRFPRAPATTDLCNSSTVIYSSSTVPVTAAPASVLDRKLLLPCYRFLRCDAPAAPVVATNKAFLPLETMFRAELVTSAAASQNRSRINTVHCTGHRRAE